LNSNGEFEEVTPDDLRQMKAYIDKNRTLTTPFDVVTEGKTGDIDPAQVKDKLQEWVDAGATWWVEGLWEASQEQAAARLHQGPPRVV
jgi:hypothetical protein